MQKQYRYSFQKGGLKGVCPDCGCKTLVRYVDAITGEYCPERYGRCDREIKCGYHCRPEFEKVQTFKPYKVFAPKQKPQLLTPIPFEVLGETFDDYEQNIFIQNLLQRVVFPFEQCDIESIISLYYLGTVASYGGAVTLPYIDIDNNIRAIQVKQFDETNHTVKNKTSFLHSILKYQYSQRSDLLPDWLQAYELNDLKVSCLFGEHLLNKYPLNPVALVEAPKSAIYGTLYFGLPTVSERFLWLAVYNLSSLNVEKCKALKGRNVVLFPDLSKDGKAFNLWSEKAKELNAKIQGAKFTVSDLLENRAGETERLNGCDIADYLICQDWRLFRQSVIDEAENKHYSLPTQNIIEKTSVKSVKSVREEKHILCTPLNEKRDYRLIYKADWSNEITELKSFFDGIELLIEPIKLNSDCIIFDVSLFINSHLATVKANNGQVTFQPYLTRLQQLKAYFIAKSKEK